jgi:hypothetical protein
MVFVGLKKSAKLATHVKRQLVKKFWRPCCYWLTAMRGKYVRSSL